MIRAVPFDYFNCGRDDHIAFFCTVTDCFFTFGDEQAWESMSELQQAMDRQGVALNDPIRDRIKALCPLWFLDDQGK